jgi:hypothetical protein
MSSNDPVVGRSSPELASKMYVTKWGMHPWGRGLPDMTVTPVWLWAGLSNGHQSPANTARKGGGGARVVCNFLERDRVFAAILGPVGPF